MLPEVYWLSPAGSVHLVAFGLMIPMLAWLQRRKLVAGGWPLGPRLPHYRRGVASLIVFAALSLATAWSQRIQLFPASIDRPWISIAAAIAMYVIAVTLMRPRWRRAVERGLPHVYYFMPDTREERRWWIAVSILAGISEEITWRGVQPALAAFVVGSPVAGALVAAISFGAAHATQGWKSASLIVLFALAFQSLVWLSGTLVLAMAVHAAYDVTAGLAYARFGRQLGYKVPPKAPTPP